MKSFLRFPWTVRLYLGLALSSSLRVPLTAGRLPS
nr:MAG TPA: hypothetical protein [Caudoviricetes sp.]